MAATRVHADNRHAHPITLDLDTLRDVVADIRGRYLAVTDAEADRHDREDWALLWSRAVCHAQTELLRPGSDAADVQADLAALLWHWRRAMLDPVRM